MSARRTLVALSSDPTGPVVRHRALCWKEPLRAAGVDLEVVAWPKGWLARREALGRVERAGHVWVMARLLRPVDVERLRVRARRLLFDVDDALPYRDTAHGAGRSRTRTERFRAVVEAADAVSAGNSHLARLVEAVGGTATVLPTVVEVPDGPPAPEPPSPPAVVGWIGSRVTLPYLERSTLALAAVVTLGHPIRLRVVADAPPLLPPGIPLDLVRWTLEGEAAAIDGFHVGIAPLPDDPWTRGKCGLKVVQTLARGRPVVASAVGVQAEQVVHGVTGYAVRTDEDFVDALERLLSDPPLRRRMGEAAKEDARARWSTAAWRDRVTAFVEEALA